jgi:hypothetical protein
MDNEILKKTENITNNLNMGKIWYNEGIKWLYH